MRRLILNFGSIWELLMYVRKRSVLRFNITAGEQTTDV